MVNTKTKAVVTRPGRKKGSETNGFPPRGFRAGATGTQDRTDENGLNQQLDGSGGDHSSRVRNRNAILGLGILRRSAVGIYYHWRSRRKNLQQSILKDFHDAMNKFIHRLSPPMNLGPEVSG